MIRPPPRSPLFPYPTLFQSVEGEFVARASFTIGTGPVAGDTVSVKAEFLGDETHEASSDTKTLNVVDIPPTAVSSSTTTAVDAPAQYNVNGLVLDEDVTTAT